MHTYIHTYIKWINNKSKSPLRVLNLSLYVPQHSLIHVVALCNTFMENDLYTDIYCQQWKVQKNTRIVHQYYIMDTVMWCAMMLATLQTTQSKYCVSALLPIYYLSWKAFYWHQCVDTNLVMHLPFKIKLVKKWSSTASVREDICTHKILQQPLFVIKWLNDI